MGSSTDSKTKAKGALIGFEAKHRLAADKLRNNMEAAEYKHVVLGLIFLKYISYATRSRTFSKIGLTTPSVRTLDIGGQWNTSRVLNRL